MSYASCSCCEGGDRCPSHEWITLARWTGDKTIPNDLRSLSAVWDGLKLSRYENTTWQWRVIVLGTGSTKPTSKLIIGQNQRPYREWTAPIVDVPPDQIFKLEFAGLKWDDSAETAVVVGGTFTLTLEIDGVSNTTAPLAHDATANDVKAAIEAMSIAVLWDAVDVVGGPMTTEPLAITITNAKDVVSITSTPLLIGTDPRIGNEVVSDGNAGPPVVLERQIVHYTWPASRGTYRLRVTAKGKTCSTDDIDVQASAGVIAASLCRLPNLKSVPQLTVASFMPLTNTVHRISIADGETVTGGTFKVTLTVNGSTETTEDIGVDDLLAIGTAIRGLSNFLPTDVVMVRKYGTTPGLFPIEIEYSGTLSGVSVPAPIITSALKGGEVSVTSTGWSLTTHVRHMLTFAGALAGVDLVPVAGESALINLPFVKVSRVSPSPMLEFRAEYEPLNVGFLWKHFLRNAWGNNQTRELRQVRRWTTDNPGGTYASQRVFTELGIGEGVVNWGGCGGGFEQVGVRDLAPASTLAKALFDKESGTIAVSGGGLELAFQVRCVGCHYAAEFSLWGPREQSTLSFYRVANNGEPDWPYDEEDESFVCGEKDVCRSFTTRQQNIPYQQHRFYGPDGFDGHLINDVFFAQGAKNHRKPPCKPDVVLLGDGYWTEWQFSRMFDQWICKDNGAIDGAVAVPTLTCEVPWKEETSTQHPTSAIDRMKLLFGTSFSFWGGWIDYDKSFERQKIVCCFDRFGLDDIKVLFLGGLPVAGCPQTVSTFGKILYQTERDRYATWLRVVKWDIDVESLAPLRKWLDDGSRVLVLDGGFFPVHFAAALGLASTVERFVDFEDSPHSGPVGMYPATTLNGSLHSRPCWGAEIPDWTTRIDPYFEACYCEPEPHVFTTNVASALSTSGGVNLDPDWTFDGTNIAGHPTGTPRATRGLLTVSQKYAFDTNIYWGAWIPTSGLRSYTTAIPRVTPGPGAVVLGRVKGVLPQPPWYQYGAYVTAPIDYPGIVCESWRESEFRLRFKLGGVVQDTAILTYNSTASEIQTALESLATIGSGGVSVTGVALPGDIEIEFVGPLQRTDVPMLEVVESSAYEIELVADGDSRTNEKQRLVRKKNPSRIIVSAVNELIDPEAWGVNWANAQLTERELSNGAHITQTGDNKVGVIQMVIDADENGATFSRCRIDYFASYGVDGYGWGRGLTSVASAQFLLNLLKHREDY